jgi:hypothetical protein
VVCHVCVWAMQLRTNADSPACSDIAGIVFTATAIAVSHLHLCITNTTPKMP